MMKHVFEGLGSIAMVFMGYLGRRLSIKKLELYIKDQRPLISGFPVIVLWLTFADLSTGSEIFLRT